MSTLKDQILSLRSKGKTYSEIVRELGCSKGTVSYYCGVGQREARANRQRDRRSLYRKIIQEYKQKSGCIDCGENYPYWVLDFDHLYDKKFDIGNLRYVSSVEDLMNEIAKCEVVCANCHRLRTHRRLSESGGGDVGEISRFYG